VLSLPQAPRPLGKPQRHNNSSSTASSLHALHPLLEGSEQASPTHGSPHRIKPPSVSSTTTGPRREHLPHTHLHTTLLALASPVSAISCIDELRRGYQREDLMCGICVMWYVCRAGGVAREGVGWQGQRGRAVGLVWVLSASASPLVVKPGGLHFCRWNKPVDGRRRLPTAGSGA
jgi:hypothetical protein